MCGCCVNWIKYIRVAFTCLFQSSWQQSSSSRTWILLHSHLSCLTFCMISAEDVNLVQPYLFCYIIAVSIARLRPLWVTLRCCVSRCGETHGWFLVTLEAYLWSQYRVGSTGMSSTLHWVTVIYANVTLSRLYSQHTPPHTHIYPDQGSETATD